MSAPHPVLVEALGRYRGDSSDIHDHLGTLFMEAVAARPRLIVELGTRGGVSTRALLAGAAVTGAQMLSVDINDCSGADLPEKLRQRWKFIRSDDVSFAGEPFAAFCQERGLPPQAEVIFIDTSHEFEHTRAELQAWIPRLAPSGLMMFHDTNMQTWFRSLNGKVYRGWDNRRGVIRAIEEVVGRQYDADTFFSDIVHGFAIVHAPWSSGFTVMRKIAG
jgi:predicted O-methyltransferase YrrM